MSNRISTRVLEDAGDVIRDVNLVDVSASESLVGAEHDPTLPVLWRPATGGTDLYQFRVKSRSSTAGGHVQAHQLETMLGRLSRIYPPSVLARGTTINAATGGTGDTATISKCLTYALQKWKEVFTWLEWETIPELSVQTTAGVVTPVVDALALRQSPNSPTSARRWIDEMLSLFSGYVLRVNSAGKLQVVPPGSTQPVAVTLTANQIYTREPSTSLDDIVNRATVQSRHWQYEQAQLTEHVTISAAADDPDALNWATGNGGRGTSFQHLGTYQDTISGSVLVPMKPDLLPGSYMYLDAKLDMWSRTRDDPEDPWSTVFPRNQELAFFQEVTIDEDASAGETTLTVAPLAHPLLNGSTFRLPGMPAFNVTSNVSAGATSIPVNALPADIPGGTTFPHSRIGMSADDPPPFVGSNIFVLDVGSEGAEDSPWARLRLNWDGENLRLQWTALRLEGPPGEDLLYIVAYRVALTVIGWNWGESRTTVNATFGDAGDSGQSSVLPGFVVSQDEFGIVERKLNAGFVNLGVDDAMAIAQAYVAANMNARERITLEVTPDLPVRPEHINRRVNADGTEIIIESWEHTEVFDNTSASVTTRVTGVVNNRMFVRGATNTTIRTLPDGRARGIWIPQP